MSFILWRTLKQDRIHEMIMSKINDYKHCFLEKNTTIYIHNNQTKNILFKDSSSNLYLSHF